VVDASAGAGSAASRPSWPEETIPTLHVADADLAVRWYERLGFAVEWTHRFEPGFPAFVSIRRGDREAGVRIFLSEHGGDAEPKGSVYLRVADIVPIAGEFATEVRDTGARYELGLADPDGNHITVGTPTGRSEPGYSYPD
jgi:catechol 2,3-dioxygenase-like lactoylglutathione lyase family enzyme